MKKHVFDSDAALQLMLENTGCMKSEKLAVEKVSGRILSADVKACYDVPLFDRSPLDGYALCAAETEHASADNPVRFAVSVEIPAGAYSQKPLEPGFAAKILTGAPIPEGADAVIRFEDTESADGYVSVYEKMSSGDNIVRQGEDVRKGEVIASKGTVIDAAVHGMIASQGIPEVEVYKAPLIGIISQGDELLDPGVQLRMGKIYNSNRYMLGTALKREGFSSIYLGIVPDDVRKIQESLKRAASMYDAVIMTGGVSVGDYDYSEEALEKAGAEILVDRVMMKPGSSCCLAMLDGVPMFALSGNPSAAMTTFHLIAVPVLRKISGRSEYGLTGVQVRMAERYPKKSPTKRILKGRISLEKGEILFYPNAHQQNGAVSSMKGAEVFAVVPAGSGPVEPGTLLDAYLLS